MTENEKSKKAKGKRKGSRDEKVRKEIEGDWKTI